MGGFSTRMSGVRELIVDMLRKYNATELAKLEPAAVDECVRDILHRIGRPDLAEALAVFAAGGEDAWGYISKNDDLVVLEDLIGVSPFPWNED